MAPKKKPAVDNAPFFIYRDGEIQIRDKRAEAVLRRLKKQSKEKEFTPVRYAKNDGVKERVMRAAGIEGTATRVTQDGTRTHHVEFGRVTEHPGDTYEPRKNISPKGAKLRRANISYQMGQLLGEVNPGDMVEAQPVESESGRNPRARVYDRATNGALASEERQITANYSQKEVKSEKLGGDKWLNAKGQVKKFDPKKLKADLVNMAKGSVVKGLVARLGGPVAQAAMTGDEAFGALTGKKISQRLTDDFQNRALPLILKRLREGHRVTPTSPLAYGR